MTDFAEPADDDIDALAGLDFLPWEADATGWTPPTNAEWAMLANPHLISVRLAWPTVHKSQDELIAVARQLGDDGLEELVGQIGRSADWFEGLQRLLASAEAPILCASAALNVR